MSKHCPFISIPYYGLHVTEVIGNQKTLKGVSIFKNAVAFPHQEI